MRKLLAAAVAVAALVGGPIGAVSAQAEPSLMPGDPNLISVQFAPYFWGGRNYCWYDSAWSGPGYYWCGYAWRRGYGFGGGRGWHGWSGGRGYYGGYHGGFHGGYHGGFHGGYHGGYHADVHAGGHGGHHH